jgi:hypothetical protein
MAKAKDILVKPITAQAATALVRRVHYSGKVATNSQLHLGVFLDGVLEGAMQFGPSMDKRKTLGLVRDTAWNGFLELNRMAFTDRLPRNSESRALGVALRMIRKTYPHIEWVISFSDATQCGDGTIYRAAGFVLTGIKENKTIMQLPDGSVVSDKTLNNPNHSLKGKNASWWKRNGAKPLIGYQLRYVYFLNPSARERLTVPVVPFDKIDTLGAGMYRGERVSRSSRAKGQDPETPSGLGGSTPTRTLHTPAPTKVANAA